jgi:hypothetical protein
MSKNDLSHKFSIFNTTKNWVNIFENFIMQTEIMDPIYYFHKPEMVLQRLSYVRRILKK